MTQAIVMPSGGGSGQPWATAMGFDGWSLADPSEATSPYALTAGLFVAVLVPLQAGAVIAKLGCELDTAGVTSTGTNEMALYSVAGVTATRQALTGDMTATFSGALGWVEGTLGAAYTVPTTGLYYVTAVTHFTTLPKILGSTAVNSAQSFPQLNGFYPSVFIAASASSPASFDASAATRNSAAYLFTAR